MFSQPKNRFQAFGIHLLISAIIFIVLAAIIIFCWYPGFLFRSDGGWQGIRLIAGVDFIIGPTLTLIVYKLGKPSLKFDLSVIALIQIACLAVGTWLVYQERPLAIVYANGSFYTMSENSFRFHDHDSKQALKHDTKIPAWIFVRLPEDKQARSRILIRQLSDGPIHARIDLYEPYRLNLETVLSESIERDLIEEEIQNDLSDKTKVYNFIARYSNSYIEIDGETGKYVALHKKPEQDSEEMQIMNHPASLNGTE